MTLALALLAAACGGDDAGGSATTTTAPPTTAPTTAPTPAPTTTEPPTTTAAPPVTNIEVATINVLHGITPPVSDCALDTDQCNVEARVQILWNYLENDLGCPEIIAFQEIAARWFEVVPGRLPDLCGGNHVLLTEDLMLFDQEMILTTLPVIEHERTDLAGKNIWSAHWAQLEGGDGLVVDVFSTHYASSSANPPCSPDTELTTCHPDCPADSLLGDCHPYETLAFLAERAAPGSLQLIIGDLNKRIDEPRIQTLIQAGFIDTHLAAGNPECPEEGGPECTTGIGNDVDTDYAGLDVSDNVPKRRIDFVLARPPEGCDLVVDSNDADGDGTDTGGWANTPLDEPYEGLYWPSDHTGIQADVGIDCA